MGRCLCLPWTEKRVDLPDRHSTLVHEGGDSFTEVNTTTFFTGCGQRLNSIKKDYKSLPLTRKVLHKVIKSRLENE